MFRGWALGVGSVLSVDCQRGVLIPWSGVGEGQDEGCGSGGGGVVFLKGGWFQVWGKGMN